MKFGPLGAAESDAIMRIGEEFGVDIEGILEDKALLMVLEGRREIFVTTPDVAGVMENLGRDPYSVGLYIGEIKRERFFLGLEGASLIVPHTNKKVFVNETAEQLFLYGRDVFYNSIVDFSACKLGDRCLVVNAKGELLGIGKLEKDMVKNLMDRGWYLRKGE